MKNLSQNLELVAGKKVIIRANFDVPIEEGQVQDTTRIESSIPTIKALREKNCIITLLAHYDRPDGKYDQEKSLRPVAVELEKLINEPVEFIEYSPNISDLVIPHSQSISLVENLRFWKGEEENNSEFALALSKFGEYFINDAFANCHRQHASIVGIPNHLPSFASLSLEKEIDVLFKFRENPEKPFIVVLGGAKLETKEPMITAFKDKADYILVGGKIAVDIKEKNITLPKNVIVADLTEDKKDITKESAKNFANLIQSAKSVIWNGTMGVFEEPEHQQGTKIVAEAVNTTPAFTLTGGGDTETALTLLDQEKGIDFISTGGGAMLTYFSTGDLPGINALK